MAGCLRAPAARKATVQRGTPTGEDPSTPAGGGTPQGISRWRWGEGGARAGAGGRVGVGGRAQRRFFFSDLVVLDVFLTCSGGRGEAPARGTAYHALYLQGVTVGMAL